jgi:methyl-accepting chemotaxis protein
MKIKTKLTGTMIGVASIFTLALLVAVLALNSQTKSFDKFVAEDLENLVTTGKLHANGIQIGQATRNIMLDPSDLKAVDNYRKAAMTFTEDLARLTTSFSDKPEHTALLGQLKQAWTTNVGTREEVQKLALEKRLGEATALLTEKETVQWREVKDLILKLEMLEEKAVKTTGSNFKAKAVKTEWLMLGLLSVALLISTIAVVSLIRMITAPLIQAGEIAELIAAGDLTVTLPAGTDDEVSVIRRSINHISQHLSDVIAHITESSCSVASASVQLQGSTERITVNLGEVESQTISLGTASEEMAATSADIARNCHMAASNSSRASAEAQAGVTVVHETINDMQKIAERVRSSAATVETLGQRSEQIGAIVGTIEDIADQTNLLALNAAIEAARAGEQGRGFAVVADEVRALAERTTRATHEISAMIKRIQNETGTAVSVMEEGVQEVEQGMHNSRRSEKALTSILDSVSEVTSQIDQIATAAEEQTATTQEIASNIHRVTTALDTSSHSSRENAEAVSQLTRLSEGLLQLVRQFKVTGNELLILDLAKNDHKMFVNSVRSAVLGLKHLDPASLSTHRTCRFGKWYSDEGQNLCGSLSSFKAIDTPHDRIHSIAKEAIAAVNSGNQQQANQLLATAEKLSEEMVVRLDEIKQEYQRK